MKTIIILILTGVLIMGCEKETDKIPNEKPDVVVPYPTEYRIVPIRNHIADSYLQFKVIVAGKEEWRFVPEELYGTVSGKCLIASDCPGDIENVHTFMISDIRERNSNSEEFVKKYPNINIYFVHLQLKREEYLYEQKQMDQRDTVYLKGE